MIHVRHKFTAVIGVIRVIHTDHHPGQQINAAQEAVPLIPGDPALDDPIGIIRGTELPEDFHVDAGIGEKDIGQVVLRIEIGKRAKSRRAVQDLKNKALFHDTFLLIVINRPSCTRNHPGMPDLGISASSV